jgi:hypothetical protein
VKGGPQVLPVSTVMQHTTLYAQPDHCPIMTNTPDECRTLHTYTLHNAHDNTTTGSQYEPPTPVTNDPYSPEGPPGGAAKEPRAPPDRSRGHPSMYHESLACIEQSCRVLLFLAVCLAVSREPTWPFRLGGVRKMPVFTGPKRPPHRRNHG